MEKEQVEYCPNTGSPFKSDKLLPCPCCGGEAVITFFGNDYTKSRGVIIKCDRCSLQRTDRVIRNNSEWCAKVSILKWNMRTK